MNRYFNHTVHFLIGMLMYSTALAQTAMISGQLEDSEGAAIIFANVALYQSQDSALVKVAPSDEHGQFSLQNLSHGNYFLKASYVGYADLHIRDLDLAENQALVLRNLLFRRMQLNWMWLL